MFVLTGSSIVLDLRKRILLHLKKRLLLILSGMTFKTLFLRGLMIMSLR